MSPLRRPSADPLWREEFSVFAADEQYVGRRQFAKFLVLTSVGMFVGQTWILLKSWRAREPVLPEQVVAMIADVPVKGVVLFHYPTPNDPCILVRLDQNRFAAYSQKCTHLSCAVHYVRESGELVCPCHEGHFSATTGQVLQGPPPRPLPRILLRQDRGRLLAIGVDLQSEGHDGTAAS
jgi:nitrite reductase/ring-hydroxylating ferredoxin subunit